MRFSAWEKDAFNMGSMKVESFGGLYDLLLQLHCLEQWHTVGAQLLFAKSMNGLIYSNLLNALCDQLCEQSWEVQTEV